MVMCEHQLVMNPVMRKPFGMKEKELGTIRETRYPVDRV